MAAPERRRRDPRPMAEALARLHQATPDRVAFADGMVTVGGEALTWDAAVEACYLEPRLALLDRLLRHARTSNGTASRARAGPSSTSPTARP